MIVLSQTTDKIQIVLGGAVATNQAQCVASWRDITATPTYTPGRSVAVTNGTTDVDFIASPGASTQRVIDYISVYNSDTASITATVKFDANGTDYILWKGILSTGEALEYEDGKGWTTRSLSGLKKYVGDTGASGADGADGALTVTEVEIDMGATPVFEKQITVTNASITSTSKIIAVQSGAAPTGGQSDENQMDFLLMNCTAGTGSFVLNVKAIPGPVSGVRKINYQFS